MALMGVGNLVSSFVVMVLQSKYLYSGSNSFIYSILPSPRLLSLFTVNIHKNHLEKWIDVSTLDASRVKIVDSIVKLKGPVWIIPPITCGISCEKLNFMEKVAWTIAIASLATSLVVKLRPTPPEKGTIHTQEYTLGSTKIDLVQIRSNIHTALVIISFLATPFIAWKQLSKIMPSTSGIFFYNLPFTR